MTTKTLKKILVANRGEIACRVMRTAKQMGLTTVAVYSDADKHAQHVKLADEAYHIGPAPSKDSYLVADKIIDVAKQTSVDCIHPGYGFLSENSEFALACEQNDIAFIGPPASSIEAMGSKTRAKEIMHEANVPLVPGYYGDNQDTEFLKAEAEKIGYPVLIKAAFGGGGKGMRVVEHAKDFISALEGAKREAKAGFGNDLVLLERYVTKPRHVEVQVFADNHGNCVYLGDRDCSLQRRHQKVIEEAPAPGLSDSLRKEMGEAAVRCAQAINYRGAGTVEFLLCGDEFFFMEMNTRLQVEHPVTEMVTGVDLVSWQINVAAGGKLPLSQADIQLQGHSFEARIYAEDPSNDFIPCSGRIDALFTPTESEFVRIDTGIAAGDEISPFYDPMIAKLIVHDDNREAALGRLSKALQQFHLAGFSCNVNFLHNLANHPTFQAGAPDTHFIEDQGAQLVAKDEQQHTLATVIAAFAYMSTLKGSSASPWQQLTGFMLNSAALTKIPFTDVAVQAEKCADGFKINLNSVAYTSSGTVENGLARLVINGEKVVAHVIQTDTHITVMYNAQQTVIELIDKHYISEHESDALPLAAPLNGTVVKHLVAVGSEVVKGDAVVIIEAMKMEYTLNAPHDGVLTSYCFGEGELVSHGDMLAIVEEQEAV
ncbi:MULTISPECIES: acetyl/propionyl/methylcrotonyl-CoA carboxylase subunit alpha [Pseudoalteromonas]|uniref:Biotin carboxylase n=1 Tax=Pseudoalteromonas lipolytica TaxID=570156 RepID=A0AAD0RZ15_9GAMM|nr:MULTISPECIES: acetyl/propionyl/methylcrotonyl-CoA carboxylase subunit alpha [Pseudoalteromonas]AXV65205.1 acetyl/propionyl/methylcrotonyl-CoA carboxylase subunit alpha [Pseudoalteromonas donghaensis]MAE01455.1 3-methylcrotonyl-CoA carboxylase [Pseudoalteromonas sp.]QMW15918.1 acetyl/propionyl/methylcrotonyl-CoA carboxylase subunit alpha [Pseudoalteromonas sp. MT33b]|tara:strand:+ start:496 stop:2463 length:1968 start_codon:yes stop_codon:yes gene_type:complete